MERVLKSVEWCVYGGERFGRRNYAIRSGLILKPAGTQCIPKDDSQVSSFFYAMPSIRKKLPGAGSVGVAGKIACPHADLKCKDCKEVFFII